MLSAIIIAKNEEENIERSVKSVGFADEVVVIDSGSTDNTAAIARKAGAVVIDNPWPGYGAQKNFGASKASGDWLLFIDADEEVPEALRDEIKQMLKKPVKDFYWLRITTVFLGKPLSHLFGHNLRLFKKSSGKWTEAAVHEQVLNLKTNSAIKLGDAESEVLGVNLLHHSHPTIKSYFKKMHKYTSLDAKEMQKTGKHRSGRSVRPAWWLPYWLAKRQFLKMYFYKKGFLDGFAGLIWCNLSAYYEFEMAKKYLKSCE